MWRMTGGPRDDETETQKHVTLIGHWGEHDKQDSWTARYENVPEKMATKATKAI